jgi:hypothetical protein
VGSLIISNSVETRIVRTLEFVIYPVLSSRRIRSDFGPASQTVLKYKLDLGSICTQEDRILSAIFACEEQLEFESLFHCKGRIVSKVQAYLELYHPSLGYKTTQGPVSSATVTGSLSRRSALTPLGSQDRERGGDCTSFKVHLEAEFCTLPQ